MRKHIARIIPIVALAAILVAGGLTLQAQSAYAHSTSAVDDCMPQVSGELDSSWFTGALGQGSVQLDHCAVQKLVALTQNGYFIAAENLLGTVSGIQPYVGILTAAVYASSQRLSDLDTGCNDAGAEINWIGTYVWFNGYC